MISSKSFSLLTLIVYLFVGFLAYSNSLHSPFMIDDHGFFDEKMRNVKYLYIQFIPDKETVLGLEDQKGDSYYRPLAHIIPMLCYLTFRDNYFGYHVFNLLLFCAAAFLLFLFLDFVFKDRRIAFLAGLFYLIHPINGVVVNYITASVFAAQVIFMLASLWFFMASKEIATSPTAPRKDNTIISLFFFVLALMCHETSMALPFYLVLLLVCAQGEHWFSALKRTWSFWALLVVYFIFRQHYASLNDSILTKFKWYHMSVFQYLASIAQLIVWYLSKLFFPVGIVLIKAIPVARTQILFWCSVLIALAMAAGGLIYSLRQKSLALTGLAWFCFGFLPFFLASMFQPIHGLMLEPHWFVFPVIGFFIFLAWLFTSCLERLLRFARNDTVLYLLSLFLIIPWAISDRVHNYLWSDEIRYCQYWLKESPNFSAVIFYMAKAYEIKKDYVSARHYYMESLKLHYKDWIIYTNLGLIDLIEGKWALAKQHLEMALRYDNRLSVVLSNLGALAFKDADYPKARDYFLRAIESNRFVLLPRLDLGITLTKMGDTAGAIKAYEDVLSIDPSDEIAMVALVQMYMTAKDKDDAVRICRQLIRYSSRPLYIKNAAVLLKYYGYPDEAAEAFAKADRFTDL